MKRVMLSFVLLLSAADTSLCYTSDEFVWPSELPELKVNEETFKKQNLECHNEFRRIHGVHPLLSSTKLDRLAQKYASIRAGGGTPRGYGTYGINYMISKNIMFDGLSACMWWYDQEHLYDYSKDNLQLNNNSASFQQVVSRASCFIGVGLAKSKSNVIHSVVLYNPPDNPESKIYPPGYSFETELNPFELLMLTPVCTNSEKIKYMEQNLQCHNTLRKMHGIQPLEYSNKLTKYAEDLAEWMASEKRVIQRKGPYNYCAMVTAEKETLNGYQYCQVWYDKALNHSTQYFHSLDAKMYMTNEASCYSQIIWKSTHYIGFALDIADDGSVYTVAVYDPPGNIRGEYKNNIFPVKHNKMSSSNNFQTSLHSINLYITLFCLYLVRIYKYTHFDFN